jgi:outer membrane protein TolC
LSFNAAYNFTQLRNKVVINTFTPFFNENKGFNYGFGLNIPIVNNFNTRRLIEQAKLDIRWQELNYKNELSLIETRLSTVFMEYEQAKKSLELEEENILLARENVNDRVGTFQAGFTFSN